MRAPCVCADPTVVICELVLAFDELTVELDDDDVGVL
jgi:hypothetical protein